MCYLSKYQISIYYFCGYATDVIHTTNPFHLIIRFKFSVTPSRSAIRLISRENISPACLPMSARYPFKLPLVSRLRYRTLRCCLIYRKRRCPQYADKLLFFFRKLQAKNVIVTLQFIPKPLFFIINNLLQNPASFVDYFEFLLLCVNDFQQNLVHSIGVLIISNKASTFRSKGLQPPAVQNHQALCNTSYFAYRNLL